MKPTNIVTIVCAVMIGYQIGVYIQKKRQQIRDTFGKAAYKMFYGEEPKS